jgi:hypothetical protein
MRKYALLIFIFFQVFRSDAGSPLRQENFSLRNDSVGLIDVSPVPDKSRLKLIGYTIAITYPVSMAWLYTQWYQDYPQSSFHFFNDNGEWLQVDKVAHMWNTYNISKPLMKLFYWAGVDQKKSALYGAGIAYVFQTTIEIFDGFSSEWGFSYGDAIANTLGAGALVSQQLIWDQQRIVLKYSFHQTEYADYRPDVLGSNVMEGILKDYNGLTCWMSINPYSFMKKDCAFPKWLSLGLGYGAEGMTGGFENPTEVDGQPIPQSERYRQYYLAIDFDLARIKTRSKFWGGLFKLINIIHLPAPTIEFNQGRATKFHALYF